MLRLFSVVFCLFTFFSCAKPQYNSPAAYNLSKPVTIDVKQSLHEISGICFKPGDDNMIYAVEDERGKIYSINLADNYRTTDVKFGDKGDYEDLVFAKGKLYVLNSAGSIIGVDVNAEAEGKYPAMDFGKMLPPGEYEGMASLGDTLFVLCKHCRGVTEKKSLRIYKLAINDSGALADAGYIEPEVSVIGPKGSKERLFPSGLAYNPVNKQWFVVSGVNKLVVIFDDAFQVVDHYFLDPAIYEQPEGITFNSSGDLFISNESHSGKPNILLMKKQQ